MVRVLYIDCCIRREESRTRILAEAFLAALEAQPDYQLERLCLMDEPLTALSEGFFLSANACSPKTSAPIRGSVTRINSARLSGWWWQPHSGI